MDLLDHSSAPIPNFDAELFRFLIYFKASLSKHFIK